MIRERLQQSIGAAVERTLGVALPAGRVHLERTKDERFGDWACNVALQLAKEQRRNPRELAQQLVSAMSFDGGLVDRAEVAGPGFINFTLAQGWYYKEIEQLLSAGVVYGRHQLHRGQRAQVEFVSCNPTGPLNVGHGRQAAIGDACARLLEALGYQVTREYYFNDAGLQMKVLANSVLLRYRQLLGGVAAFPEDHYQGDYIRDVAAKCRAERGDGLGQADLEYFKQAAVAAIFQDIKATLHRMGVAFDVYFNESSLYKDGEVQATLAGLRTKGKVYEADGAVWFKATDYGAEKDRVLVRSTGEPTYRLPDIAYHRNKFARGFDFILDIFGSDHQAQYPDVVAALKALGYDASKLEVRIHQFVTLTSGGQQVKMSTRKANFITLDELLDEVGVDAARYFFLMRRMEAHLDFDLELAKKQSDENPVFYVQYAHARICSILEHAQEKGVLRQKADLSLLKEPEEVHLIKHLIDYPELVLGAAQAREPHRIPTYLQDLAGVFHNFYHKHRVVTEDQGLTNARLDLCQAARTVIANGLKLLGVSAPERM